MARDVPAAVGSQAAAVENKPVELYEVYLDTGTLRYAQADDHVVFGTQTYTALGISRSPVRTAAELAVDEVTIQLDNVDRGFATRVVATDFVGRNLIVKKAFVGQLDSASKYVVVFDGRMDEPTLDQSKLTIKVRSWLDAMHHRVPRRIYATPCNYQLYDAACGAAKTAGTNLVSGTATGSSTPSTLVSAVLSGYADNYWGPIGTLRLHTGSNANLGREVLASSQSSNSATARVAFPYAVGSGDSFTLTRGCRKTTADCRSKFDNFVNYGGFPTIPKTPLI